MAKPNDSEIFKRILVDFVGADDPLLSMLQWTTDKLMQIEAENKVGAVKGVHSEQRQTHFSGKRVRRFDTRLGTMYLMIPKLRKGGYIPFFVSEKKRSEQALISLVQEAYINGVSTRKVDRLAKSLGIEGISAGQVSVLNQGLNEQVEQYRNRPLQKEYPFIWIDALYEKVRLNGEIISVAIMVALGVNTAGQREILSIEPMLDESAENWQEFFLKLKARGFEKAHMFISDAHKGIQKALREEMIGCKWQRCKVHFMRNIMASVPAKYKARWAEQLKQIWLQPDKESALKTANNLIVEYAERYPKAITCLEDGLEDSLQFYSTGDIDKRKISSTNILERLNREIRRRSRVVGIFPSETSYIRLVASYLMEYTEDWETDSSYINQDKLMDLLPLNEAERLKQVA